VYKLVSGFQRSGVTSEKKRGEGLSSVNQGLDFCISFKIAGIRAEVLE